MRHPSSQHRTRALRLGTRGAVAAIATASCLAAVGCGSDSSSTTSGSAASASTASAPAANTSTVASTAAAGSDGIASLCGSKPVKVAFAKGAGDTWTKIALATLKDEASKCKNIGDVLFTDAGGNQTKGISDINGLVAQGTNLLIVMPEFGPAQLPAIRSATRAGTTVVTQIDDIGAKIPSDIAGSVLVDTAAVGQEWADWLNTNVKQGKVVFLGGIPGAQSSKQLFDALKTALAKYPKLQLVVDHVVDTNWDGGTRQRVMAGLLAKYGRIDAVVSDYGTIDKGTLNAYKQADMKLPALAAFASSNGLSCYWAKTPFPYMSVDGQTTLIRQSLQVGLKSLDGQAATTPTTVKLPATVDSTGGKKPKCDPALPEDAANGSDLSQQQLHAIFQ